MTVESATYMYFVYVDCKTATFIHFGNVAQAHTVAKWNLFMLQFISRIMIYETVAAWSTHVSCCNCLD